MEKKLNTLIVDDEILVATLLKNSIDWSAYNIDTPTIATNADAALALLSEQPFDIVFTDIHMPIINGLIFAREIARLYPHIQIIVLTGYDEFEYAKECISIGVLEYLQKPIQPNEIAHAVTRATERILSARKTAAEYAQLRDQLFTNLEYLRERILNQLVLGNLPSGNLDEQLKPYDITPSHPFITVAVLDLIQINSEDISSQLLLSQSAIKLLKQQFECTNERYAFLNDEQRIVLLAFSNQFDFYEYAQQLKSFLANNLPCHIHIGIGNTYAWSNTYYKSYQEANAVLQVLQSDSKDLVYEARSLWSNSFTMPQNYTKEIEHILALIRAGLEEKVNDQLSRLKEQIIAKQIEVAVTKSLAIELLSGITKSILSLGISHPDILTDQNQKLEKLYTCDSSIEVFDILNVHLLTITGYIKKQHVKTESQTLNQLKQYLSDELSNNMLSLTTVAKKFGYNPTYLSRLFKKDTGITFSEYLLTIRMDYAAKLIRESDLRAYQIAQQVGFIDSNYFSTCFKKYTGMTVSQYRATKM